MLGRGLRHELSLLRFLGKVPRCGETNYFAPVILHPSVKNCWERQMHLAATEVIPSARRIVQRIARNPFGTFADPSSSLTRKRLREQEVGLKNIPVRFMATDLENSGTHEGPTTKADNYVSEADDSTPVDENLAAMKEDVTTTGETLFSQGEGQIMLDNLRAESGDSSANDGLHEKVDELIVEQNLILSEDSGVIPRTTPEDLLANLDGTDNGSEKLDILGPALSEAMEKFQQARGHPAKVYVHIKSLEKIRTGQLRNVRSAGLPVKRSLYTVNRSPHVDKKARDQFDMKVHKHLLVIETETHRLHQKLTELKNHDLPGVQLKVTFQYQTRLDKSLLV